ncbi:MAG: hypothetical protein GVY12_13285 [Bacteroidetes bacterium]|jgi:hypothetical protein|nr:hypothetical protein [Bacteroidota bacterium]
MLASTAQAPDAPDEGFYADTPRGMFTAAGTWYHTSEELLRAYAAPVLKHATITELLKKAETWLASPLTVGVLSLVMALLVLPAWAAAIVSVGVYVGWAALSPSLVSLTVLPLVRALNSVWVQGLAYVFVLSVLAAQDAMVALTVGLIGFVLYRWRLLPRLLAPLIERLQQQVHPLPAPDQVLRAVVVRTAMKHRESLPELEAMERDIIKRWTRSS